MAAVLDAVGSAASATPAPESRRATEAAGLRVHLERGAAASATRAAAARWVPRIVGSVEGVVDQCGGDAEHVALLTAAMALIDVGGGLDDRFDCGRFGPALVDAVASAGTSVPSEAVAGMRALVDANAAFDRGVELEGWVRLGLQEDFGEAVLPQVLGRFAGRAASPSSGGGDARTKLNQRPFFALFSARFSIIVFAGFFFVAFFCCMPFAIPNLPW